MTATTCPNCSASIQEEAYCPSCGQRQSLGRFSLRHIINDAFSVLFNLDRGLLPTISQLTTSPGKVLKSYWSGATRINYNPMRYAFITVTVSTLITVSTGVYDRQIDEVVESEDGASIVQFDPDMTEEEKKEQLDRFYMVQEQIQKFLSFFSLIIIPFGAFATWLLLRDLGHYYGEHMIAASYYIGHTTLLSIPLIFLYYFDVIVATTQSTLSIIISIIYGVFMLKRGFDLPWWRALLTAPAAFVVGLAVVALALFLIGIAAAGVLTIMK